MSGPHHQQSPRASFETRWKARFEQFAESGENDASIAGWSQSGLDARLRNFLRSWQPGARAALWLDAGCGAGTYARHLESEGMRVIGVDYSLPTLIRARLRSPAIDAWCVGDVMHLPVRSASFDGALCFGVLQALARSDLAIQELARALRTNGELWVDALNGACVPSAAQRLWRRLKAKPQHLRYESPGRLKQLMAQGGFADLELIWVPILPTWLQPFQPALESTAFRLLMRVVPGLGRLVSHAFVLRGTKRSIP